MAAKGRTSGTQLAVFAVAFFALQVLFEVLRGTPLAPGLLASLAIISVIATAIYAGLIWLIGRRKKRGD